MAAYVQDVFMLFGDSITQGGWEPDRNAFGQRLSHVYARKLDILNRGLSGYNTSWGLPVFEQCIARKDDNHAPKLTALSIWFGANDACIPPSPQHVPLAEFASNLVKMVQMVKSPGSPYYSPATRIILITPPPVNTFQRRADLESRTPPLLLDRDFEITRQYAQAVRDVAAAEDVALVDAWMVVWQAAGEEEKELSKFLVDGLHLNAAGYEIFYDALINTIASKYPEIHYDNLNMVFPPWKELDWANPTKSISGRKAAEGN